VAGGADWAGAVLVTAAVMLGVYAIAGPAARGGWDGPGRLVAAAAAAALAGFVAREATARNPHRQVLRDRAGRQSVPVRQPGRGRRLV